MKDWNQYSQELADTLALTDKTTDDECTRLASSRQIELRDVLAVRDELRRRAAESPTVDLTATVDLRASVDLRADVQI